MVFSEMPKNRGGLTFVRKYENQRSKHHHYILQRTVFVNSRHKSSTPYFTSKNTKKIAIAQLNLQLMDTKILEFFLALHLKRCHFCSHSQACLRYVKTNFKGCHAQGVRLLIFLNSN